MSHHGPCPIEGCTLGLVQIDGIHLSPMCPAHGSPIAAGRCTCAESNAIGATSWGYRCKACAYDAERATPIPPAKGGDQ